MPKMRLPFLGAAMYKPWSIKEIESVPWNGLQVFSAFSCGGGSTMGYKLSGYKVIGNIEIDKKISEMYMKNHHPRHSYNMDIRDFLLIPDAKLPSALFHLDVLDGSPPCSVFSMAGNREDDWGKSKQFKEGQAKQTLDDLFFEYIKLIRKLKPKVYVAENVKGLITGNAKGYVAEILKGIHESGYTAQMFCLNSAFMGVPQRRERVFIIGHRKDLDFQPLKLSFREKPITFGEVREEGGKPVTAYSLNLLKQKHIKDVKLSDVNKRIRGKQSRFNAAIVWDNSVCPTITAGGEYYKACNDKAFTDGDYISCQTFPTDYDFCGQSVHYICGMSVPPFMMQRISKEIEVQWLDRK